MDNIVIEILTARDEFTPVKSHRDDAAYDVRAAITEPIRLLAGQRVVVPLGFKLGLPEGYEAVLVPRSGMAAKNGITIVNSPGTIDAGYRGEVKAILLNTDMDEPFTINPEDRIAQMKIKVILPTILQPMTKLSESTRGKNGFGSTGKS